MIKIDEEICAKCNTCVQHCVAGFIAQGPEIKEETQKYCNACGHCAIACPSGAITVLGFEDLEIPSYVKDIPVSSHALETLLRRRRSIRHYKSEPVSRKHLGKMIEAASLVPSGMNLRPFKAYACTDQEVIARIHAKVTEFFARYAPGLKQPVEGMPDSMREHFAFALDRLVLNPPKGRDCLFWDAPALLVFTATIPACIGDAWMASFAAAIYAETIPVGTCYNGLLTVALNTDLSIRPLLRIPDEEVVVSCFSLGYPDEEHFRYPPRRPMQTTWI